MKPIVVVDNSPTPERIAKMGEKWQPSKINQEVKRPYGRSRPALEIIRDKGSLSAEEMSALSQLQTFLHGATREVGLVSSYGDQRWTGTTASQESQQVTKEEWPFYCGERVRQAEYAIDNGSAWAALIFVLRDDLLLMEVGYKMGATSDNAAQKKGSRWFAAAIPKLVAHYRWRSDARQFHPGTTC